MSDTTQERAQTILDYVVNGLVNRGWRFSPTAAKAYIASELEAVRQEARQEADKWISVEDRLPEVGESVLALRLYATFVHNDIYMTCRLSEGGVNFYWCFPKLTDAGK